MATDFLPEDQLTFLLVPSIFSVCVSPTNMVSFFSLMVVFAFVAAFFTVTLQVYFLPPTFAVMAAVPAFFASYDAFLLTTATFFWLGRPGCFFITSKHLQAGCLSDFQCGFFPVDGCLCAGGCRECQYQNHDTQQKQHSLFTSFHFFSPFTC
ncbi:MAG: hypothetical protein ACLTSZ_13740 [Lachnospiraceae bacterium]